jgi:hypothetical protein
MSANNTRSSSPTAHQRPRSEFFGGTGKEYLYEVLPATVADPVDAELLAST